MALDPRRVMDLNPHCRHMISLAGEIVSQEPWWSKVHQVKGSLCFRTLFSTISRRGKMNLRHQETAGSSTTSATFEPRRNSRPLRLFFVVLLFSCARLVVYSYNFRRVFKKTAQPSTLPHLIHYGTTFKICSQMEPSGLYTSSSMALTYTRLE